MAWCTLQFCCRSYTWITADPCKMKPTPKNSVPDTDGRLWGWQAGRNCAFRSSDQPTIQAAFDGSLKQTADWSNSPACEGAPNAVNSVLGEKGILWGYEKKQRCAYRNGYYKQPQWQTAPACLASPSIYNSVRDTVGRLWGWEHNQSCKFIDWNPS